MIQELLNIRQQPFDYQYLKGLFSGYRYPRNKISSLLKSGDILALKSGLYMLSPRFGRSFSTFQIANLLYGPSYISREFALAFYGLIPEQVFEITSVSTGRKKYYDTKFGAFSYHSLKPAYYAIGYQVKSEAEVHYLMATAEKALCDTLYFLPRLPDLDAMALYLKEDLRINELLLKELDIKLVGEIVQRGAKHNLRLLEEYLLCNRNH